MLWVRIVQEKGDLAGALKIASDGLVYDPTSWRLQRSIARIRRALGQPFESTRGFYEAAIRHNQADIGLKVEVASFFFMSGRYREAGDMFHQLRQQSIPSQERSRIRETWKDSSGNDRIFDGRVARSSGAYGQITAIPDNFVAAYYRTTRTLRSCAKTKQFASRFVFGEGAYGRDPTGQMKEPSGSFLGSPASCGAKMHSPGETEAGSAGMQPCRGIAWWAHRDDDRQRRKQLLALASPTHRIERPRCLANPRPAGAESVPAGARRAFPESGLPHWIRAQQWSRDSLALAAPGG